MNTSKQVEAVNINTHQENACPIDLLSMSILRIQISMGCTYSRQKERLPGFTPAVFRA
jgi:hypothetical protein